MKEALYYQKLDKNIVQCQLCPHFCTIKENNVGICKVRKNVKGKLYSLVYGRAVAAHIDPIEKKPLYHCYPGTSALSIGTVGCNLCCKHCQNWETSQAKPSDFFARELSPEHIVEMAKESECTSIAYTYNEPTIFYEYMLDTAKLARNDDIKNVVVTNGFINPEPLQGLCTYIDAVNCDLKSFDDSFYKKICGGRLEPVLETLKILHKHKIWLEIAVLIIPTFNNKPEMLTKMCTWIKENLGTQYPVHFSGFHPCYKLLDIEPTTTKALLQAREIALKVGLEYVYVGNVHSSEGNNTDCPKCRKVLVERYGFSVLNNEIKQSKCSCGYEISGKFD
jgi:pyruvate formate lyase activating enzyme